MSSATASASACAVSGSLAVDHDHQVAGPGDGDRPGARPGPRLRLLGVGVAAGQALRAEQPGAVAAHEGVLERVADRGLVDVAQPHLLDDRRPEDGVVAGDVGRRQSRGVLHGVAHRGDGQLAQVREQGPLARHEVVVGRVDRGQERLLVPVLDRPVTGPAAARGSGAVPVRRLVVARRPRREAETTSRSRVQQAPSRVGRRSPRRAPARRGERRTPVPGPRGEPTGGLTEVTGAECAPSIPLSSRRFRLTVGAPPCPASGRMPAQTPRQAATTRPGATAQPPYAKTCRRLPARLRPSGAERSTRPTGRLPLALIGVAPARSTYAGPSKRHRLPGGRRSVRSPSRSSQPDTASPALMYVAPVGGYRERGRRSRDGSAKGLSCARGRMPRLGDVPRMSVSGTARTSRRPGPSCSSSCRTGPWCSSSRPTGPSCSSHPRAC